MLGPHSAFSLEAQCFLFAVGPGPVVGVLYFRKEQKLQGKPQQHGPEEYAGGETAVDVADADADADVVAAQLHHGLVVVVLADVDVVVVLPVLLPPQHRGQRGLGWKLVESRESFASVPEEPSKRHSERIGWGTMF